MRASSDWATETLTIFLREVRGELRTRVALAGTLLFTVGTLALIALALRNNEAATPELAAALLWVTIFFAASVGLARAFVQEEERGTALALRLSARASCVWSGKFLANLSLLLVLSVVSVPVLLGMLEVNAANTGLLSVVLLLGNVGLAAVFTTTGALVAQANANNGLLAALSFPILMPLLAVGVHGAKVALGVGDVGAGWPGWVAAGGDLQVLGAFAVASVAASLFVFEFIWSD